MQAEEQQTMTRNGGGGGGDPALIVGATGYIGRFVADACLDSGHSTFLLVRPTVANPARAAALGALRAKGATIIEGELEKEFLAEKLREHKISVVISVVGGDSILDQLALVEAIQAAAGTVKRFLPSEFGHDIDRAQPVEPGLSFYALKRQVRRAVEAAGVPYTYVCCNSIAGWPYFDKTHPSDFPPPLDRFLIYGDGTVKAYFVDGTDIGKFAVMAAYDPRAAGKVVHFRPPGNLMSMNEMAALWEGKIGRALPRDTLTEADLLAIAGENRFPASIVAALTHDIFINGCQIFSLADGGRDEEISALYPDEPFKSVEECFDEFAAGLEQ